MKHWLWKVARRFGFGNNVLRVLDKSNNEKSGMRLGSHAGPNNRNHHMPGSNARRAGRSKLQT